MEPLDPPVGGDTDGIALPFGDVGEGVDPGSGGVSIGDSVGVSIGDSVGVGPTSIGDGVSTGLVGLATGDNVGSGVGRGVGDEVICPIGQL